MNDILISNMNISMVVQFLLKLTFQQFQPAFATQAEILQTSLKIGWEAYNFTQVNFSAGKTEINIIDNYLQALITTAKALYELLNDDTKNQLQSQLQKQKGASFA